MRIQQAVILTIAMGMFFSTTTLAINGDMGLTTEPLTDGSEAYPYLIEDFVDFDTFSYDHYYWASGIHTRLDCDLDLDPTLSGRQTYTAAVIAPDDQNTPFKGVFDGNDHIISNLTIDTAGVITPYLGLFGEINGVGTEVKNLGIEDSHITGAASTSQYYSGILCGYSADGALIDHCYTTGSVTGGKKLGGLCGINVDSTISHCYSTAEISGLGGMGGLCGQSSYSTITNCYATGSVTSDFGWLGGLCGSNVYATITNCHATGDVGGGYSYGYRGGLCGTNSGTVSDCYATGAVNGGNDSVGGLCGENSNGGTLRYCYATGAVDGQRNADYIGGLCGANSYGASITNCYATGAVSNTASYGRVGGLCGYQRNDFTNISYCYATGTLTSTNSYIGGLCGLRVGSNTISNSYWDTQTTGTTTSSGGVGKTTALMQTQSTFTGWNFSSIWWINDGRNYPKLDWQPVADFDNSSQVNLVDFSIMSKSWMTSDGDANYNSVCELSGDTTINAMDLIILIENWFAGPLF